MAWRRYTEKEANRYLGRDNLRIFNQEEELRLRGEPVVLTLHAPPPGLLKLPSGHWTNYGRYYFYKDMSAI